MQDVLAFKKHKLSSVCAEFFIPWFLTTLLLHFKRLLTEMGPAFDPEGMKSKVHPLQSLPDTCLLPFYYFLLCAILQVQICRMNTKEPHRIFHKRTRMYASIQILYFKIAMCYNILNILFGASWNEKQSFSLGPFLFPCPFIPLVFVLLLPLILLFNN